MPTKLIATISVLGLQGLAALGLAALAASQPEGVIVALFLGFVGLIQVLFAWALSRGKEGVRGLVAALSAIGAALQAVFAVAVLAHFGGEHGQRSDLVLGVEAGLGCALNVAVAWALTRRDVKQWMAAKSMPGAEIDAVEA